jgi:hypothetical protein
MEMSGSDAVDVISDRLEAAFPHALTRGVIEGTVRGVWEELTPDATCTAFLPLLTERIARERLRAYADDVARGAFTISRSPRGRVRPGELRHTA